MSFGGFGGFGQNNNANQQSSGFGGFGNANNTTGGGFGAAQNNTSGAFGSSTTSNPFGGFGGNTNTGGFGTSNNNNSTTSLFGNNKPTFGAAPASTGGTMFGSTQTGTTGGFGGANFGQSSANQSSGFSFGQKSGGFASTSNAPGTSLFGGGNPSTNAFGQSSNTNSFGAGTALQNSAVPPSDGTGSTAFTPHIEKDSNVSGAPTNHYQSITFMQPYQKYSFEELRLADYAAGRKSASGGQAGAFGSSTGFGGFGQQNQSTGFGSTPNNNPFGSTPASTGFAQNQPAGGFGSSATGGLFGQSKPAGGGLFGSQSSGAPSGGLFGQTQSSASGGGFGSSGTGFGGTNPPTGSNTGGGIFDQSQQSKPGSMFGNTTSTAGAPPFGGFGGTTANTGGGGLFGNTGTTNTGGGGGGGGLFGGNPQSGSGQTGGLFGSQGQGQNKPAFGGFGSTTSQPQQSGGLFGSSNPTSGGGLFGQQSQSQPPGGLFGNNPPPQQSSGSLFGSNPNNQQQSGGLFGGQKSASNGAFGPFGNGGNNQAAPSGGLFGGSNNQQSSSLFGNKPQQPAGGGGGLFGNLNNNQAPQGGTGSFFSQNPANSIFGTSQQNQGSQNLHSSLLEGNPYGTSSIWSGLPNATFENSGPLVTPLSASQRLKNEQPRPAYHRLSPMSRLYHTPPRRTGYGFSYSTYGTPSSAASTPGSAAHGGSFRGGSFGRSMTKSFSSSNLRQQYSHLDADSILAPGALAPGSARYSSGSIRRLTIDRSLKTDLFNRSPLAALPPPNTNGASPNGVTNGEQAQPDTSEQSHKLRKRVSFDHAAPKETNGTTLNGASGALVRTEDIQESPQEEQQDIFRSSRRQGGSAQPDNSSGRGKELAVVPEDHAAENAGSNDRLPREAPAGPDPQPGDYWMRPSRAEISKMPREKLQHVKDFTVGRQGCGSVTFNGEVDLTTVPLDEIYGKIVEIHVRSITVYPDASSKPPEGKGLNVPSTLRLENSWPRAGKKPSSATSGPVFDKHVHRLQRVNGTDFVSYESHTGVWTFTVPHFTRYGLDYEDDEDTTALSSPPDDLPDATPAEQSGNNMEFDQVPEESALEDDTFDFKNKKILPGAFGQQPAFEDTINNQEMSFLGDRSAAYGSDISEQSDLEESDEDMEMAGSFPQPDRTAELEDSTLQDGHPSLGTPGRALDLDGDWAEQLQRTISPRKRDRETLREMQRNVLIDLEPESEPTKSMKKSKNEFRTSIDVMNSLFGQHEERMAAAKKHSTTGKGFEWPYPKHAKTFDASEIQGDDQAWHSSFKPHWTTQGALIYAPTTASTFPRQQIEGLRDIKMTPLHVDQPEPFNQAHYKLPTNDVQLVNGVPKTEAKKIPFKKYSEMVEQWTDKAPTQSYEYLVWTCARILFDDYEDKYTAGLSQEQKDQFEDRIRKDRFCDLWEMLILRKQLAPDPKDCGTPEELAVRLLSLGDVEGACRSLLENGDYHLATLVSEIQNSDQHFRENIKSQLASWRDQGVISEMTDEIRTVYELLAGNTTICEGKTGVPNEDRASTFVMSERWNFSWLQAFGLVLFYGTLQNDPLERAIEDFASKLESGEESAYPTLDDSPTQDGTQSGFESSFWVILKMYAEMKNDKDRSIVLPQAIAQISKPFDSRFAFQLHHALLASHTVTNVDEARADQLALDLSFQFSAAGSYLDAIWSLLFITDDQAREDAIKDLLFRHAASLPEYLHPEQKATSATRAPEWDILENVLIIPRSWRCEAKALFYRSTNKPSLEFQYLLQAGLLQEAHETFITRVAPKMVVNNDFHRLRELVDLFHNLPSDTSQSSTRIEDRIPSAHTGLAIYDDYTALMTSAGTDATADLEKKAKRLSHALPELNKHIQKKLSRTHHGHHSKGAAAAMQTGGSSDEVVQMVACKIMGEALARFIVSHVSKKAQSSMALLSLPMTSEVRLSYTRGECMQYYRGVMAGAGAGGR